MLRCCSKEFGRLDTLRFSAFRLASNSLDAITRQPIGNRIVFDREPLGHNHLVLYTGPRYPKVSGDMPRAPDEILQAFLQQR